MANEQMDERARRIAEAKARAEAARAAKAGGAPPPAAEAAPPPAPPAAGDAGDERARRIAEAKARAEAAKAGGAAPAPAPAAPAAAAPAAPAAADGGDDRAARIAAARERAQAAAAAKSGGAPPPAAPQRSPEEEAARQARLAAAREKAAGAAAGGGAVAAAPAAAAATPARAAAATAPAARALPAGMDEWRVPAGSAGRVVMARPDPTAVAEAQLTKEDVANLVSRRSMMRSSFWAGLGVMLAGFVLGFVNFFWPRNIQGFGTKVTIPKERIPAEGADPVKIFEMKGYLVNLKAGEGVPQQFASFGAPSEKGGLIALYQKCPHLGCAVPWRADFDFEGVKGWFRCPCHGSTYSKAGIRVFGPAPRPMDTFTVTRNPDGSIIVDTGKIGVGGPDNAQRTIQLS